MESGDPCDSRGVNTALCACGARLAFIGALIATPSYKHSHCQRPRLAVTEKQQRSACEYITAHGLDVGNSNLVPGCPNWQTMECIKSHGRDVEKSNLVPGCPNWQTMECITSHGRDVENSYLVPDVLTGR
jgi:hypothetical protein